MVENCPISYSVQCYHVILDFKAYNLLSLLLILFKCLEDDFRMGVSALKFFRPPQLTYRFQCISSWQYCKFVFSYQEKAR